MFVCLMISMLINLLKQSEVDVSIQVIKKIQNSIHKYEGTIWFNSCDNVAWHPWINIMLVCPSGDIFISSIDTTGEQMPIMYVMH
jgi:hypothetical protein